MRCQPCAVHINLLLLGRKSITVFQKFSKKACIYFFQTFQHLAKSCGCRTSFPFTFREKNVHQPQLSAKHQKVWKKIFDKRLIFCLIIGGKSMAFFTLRFCSPLIFFSLCFQDSLKLKLLQEFQIMFQLSQSHPYKHISINYMCGSGWLLGDWRGSDPWDPYRGQFWKKSRA